MVRPGFDPGALPDIRKWFESHYTLRFDNYPVEIERLEKIAALSPCGAKKP
jgi:formylmethanofuran dehydrogenase subunit A